MTDADTFTRTYLLVHRSGPATAGTVADLLDDAATSLRQHGEVTVHHVAVDLADGTTGAGSSLTIYYDRIERRRRSRDATDLF